MNANALSLVRAGIPAAKVGVKRAEGVRRYPSDFRACRWCGAVAIGRDLCADCEGAEDLEGVCMESWYAGVGEAMHGLATAARAEARGLISRKAPSGVVGYAVDLPAVKLGRMVGREQAVACAVRAQGRMGLEGSSVWAYSATRWASMTWEGGVWVVRGGTFAGEAWGVGTARGAAVAFGLVEGEVG